jgi:chromosome partitioning protein
MSDPWIPAAREPVSEALSESPDGSSSTASADAATDPAADRSGRRPHNPASVLPGGAPAAGPGDLGGRPHDLPPVISQRDGLAEMGTDRTTWTVVRGLGWPLTRSGPGHGPTPVGLGWPVIVEDGSPVASGHETVGRESQVPVRRPDPALDDEEIAVTQHESVGGVDATFGPYPAPASHAVVTAAEFASHSPLLDDTTPLAKAAAHRLLVTEGVQLTEPLPRPDQTRVVVVANQKGGVGKTTSTVNIAASLAQHGLRVLVVDLDPQGNASTAMSLDHSEGTAGVYEVIVEGAPMGGVVAECAEVPGLFAVPASIDLAGAEIELVSLVARESRLRKGLELYLREQEEADARFDFVFIDCPPSLGLLTVNALVAGREMLIPIQCEYYALEGLGQLLKNIDLVKAHLNPELDVSAILLTMYDGRTRLASGVADEVRTHFGDVVLSTVVPRSVRISEAPSYGQTVMTYDPGSPGALSYLEAAREIATRSPQPASSSH